MVKYLYGSLTRKEQQPVYFNIYLAEGTLRFKLDMSEKPAIAILGQQGWDLQITADLMGFFCSFSYEGDPNDVVLDMMSRTPLIISDVDPFTKTWWEAQTDIASSYRKVAQALDEQGWKPQGKPGRYVTDSEEVRAWLNGNNIPHSTLSTNAQKVGYWQVATPHAGDLDDARAIERLQRNGASDVSVYHRTSHSVNLRFRLPKAAVKNVEINVEFVTDPDILKLFLDWHLIPFTRIERDANDRWHVLFPNIPFHPPSALAHVLRTSGAYHVRVIDAKPDTVCTIGFSLPVTALPESIRKGMNNA